MSETRPRGQFWLAAIALILIVGIAVEAVIAVQQWHSMQGMVVAGRNQAKALQDQLETLKQANQINQQGLVAANRAYVMFRGLNLAGAVAGDNPTASKFRINPVWENIGNTPTKDMTLYTNPAKPVSIILDMTMPKTPDISQGMLAPHTNGMGGSSYVTGQDLLNIRDGKLRLYIWGWTRYHDVFPGTPERQTRFCLIVNSVEGDPNVPGESTLGGVPCGPFANNYECTDDSCSAQR
jgi:Flp pilus assembly protein TadG